jgi:ABC-2 type transport system ATP-binding protein
LRGHTTLLVRAEPQPVALAVLRPLVSVSIVDGGLRVDAGPDRAADLVRALVRAEVDVLEVHPQERTLEDAFFALTGSDARMAAEVS